MKVDVMKSETNYSTDAIPSRGHPWDAAAAGWNNHAAMIHAWLQSATQVMLDEADIRPGARVLDIAAGAGDQTLAIARRIGPDGWVLATDISPDILALAKKNALLAGLDQISFLVADAQSLGLASERFHAAVCRLGLMFCSSPSRALSEIHAALRHQGRLSALVFSEPARNPCLAIALTTASKHRRLSIDSDFYSPQPFEPGSLMSLGKPGLLKSLLQDAGFVDIKIQSLSAPFHWPNVEQYIKFLRTAASPVIEILAPLTPSQRHNAWCDMKEQLTVFGSLSGWEGPNEFLLASATAG
jgi:ubiquinone/menaquinone biosynthesis C-methylase UbiE